MYIKDKLMVIERVILRKNVQRHMFFCVFFLRSLLSRPKCAMWKPVFFNITYEEERFYQKRLSLALGGAEWVEKAKTDILTGVIYRYLECPLCMGLPLSSLYE